MGQRWYRRLSVVLSGESSSESKFHLVIPIYTGSFQTIDIIEFRIPSRNATVILDHFLRSNNWDRAVSPSSSCMYLLFQFWLAAELPPNKDDAERCEFTTGTDIVTCP